MNTVDENRVAKKKQSGKIRKKGQIDWMITLLPLGLIAALSILFFLLPNSPTQFLRRYASSWEIPLESIILQLALAFFCSLCIWHFQNMAILC